MRVCLPIWRRGCGIRSRLSLAPAAFCSSFRTLCERLLDTRMADGVTRPGFFPQLEHRLGARSFDFETPNLRMSTLLASDLHLGNAFSDAWASLREEVDGVVDVKQSPGLLSYPAETRKATWYRQTGTAAPVGAPTAVDILASFPPVRGLVFGSTACGGPGRSASSLLRLRRRQPSVSGARLAPAPCSTRGPS